VTVLYIPPVSQLITPQASSLDHSSYSNKSVFDVLYYSSDSDDSKDTHDWMYFEPKTSYTTPSRRRNSTYRKIITKRKSSRMTRAVTSLCTFDEDFPTQGTTYLPSTRSQI
jgi:hypothetical protein